MIEEKTWKHFTLLGQAVGSIILANEALNVLVPDIFIDTHGLGFCYGWIKLMTKSTRVISYTHYPFIQKDMMSRVPLKLKQFYYKIVYKLYSLLGSHADLILANSTWTRDHLVEIWNAPQKTFVCYPPCNVKEFDRIPFSPV